VIPAHTDSGSKCVCAHTYRRSECAHAQKSEKEGEREWERARERASERERVHVCVFVMCVCL